MLDLCLFLGRPLNTAKDVYSENGNNRTYSVYNNVKFSLLLRSPLPRTVWVIVH